LGNNSGTSLRNAAPKAINYDDIPNILGTRMTQYALNLPSQLKSHAEQLATLQGISLNQFILWSVAEKVGALQSS